MNVIEEEEEWREWDEDSEGEYRWGDSEEVVVTYRVSDDWRVKKRKRKEKKEKNCNLSVTD